MAQESSRVLQSVRVMMLKISDFSFRFSQKQIQSKAKGGRALRRTNDEDLEMHENGVNRRKERKRVREVNLGHPNFMGAFTNILKAHSGSLVKI